MLPSACRNSLKRTAPSRETYRIETVHRRSSRSVTRRTCSGSGGQLRQRMRRLRLERELEHLVQAHDRMEAHLLAHVLRDVVQVGAVALREDDVRETGGVGGQRLLLQAADR